MQAHSAAAITLVNHLWPLLVLPAEQLPHRQFYIFTQYHRKTKTHSLFIDRINPRMNEMEMQVGKDWACHLKIRMNRVRDEVELFEHSHTLVREKFRLFPPRRIEGEYESEPIRGFTTKHSIYGEIIDSAQTQVRFADTFIGLVDDPLSKYFWQYECKIIGRY